MKIQTTYKECLEVSKEFNEHNDCAVIAVALAGGIPYETSHSLLRELGGRENRKPARYSAVSATLMLIGATEKHLDIEELKKSNGGRGLTPNNIVPLLDATKTYVAYVKGHVFTVRKGKLEDWTAGRKFKVLQVVEVSR